jgi:hypothetical protein
VILPAYQTAHVAHVAHGCARCTCCEGFDFDFDPSRDSISFTGLATTLLLLARDNFFIDNFYSAWSCFVCPGFAWQFIYLTNVTQRLHRRIAETVLLTTSSDLYQIKTLYCSIFIANFQYSCFLFKLF